MKKLPITLLSLSFFFAVGIPSVLAQCPPGQAGSPPNCVPTGVGNPSINVTLDNPFGAQRSLFGLVRTIINDVVLPIGGVIAVLAFVFSGFLYVTAAGNETKLKTAHKSLLYTSVGTAVLLGAWVIANVVCTTIEALGGPSCPI
ncbi:MAG: pilin [Patescibacteria group bacterium]